MIMSALNIEDQSVRGVEADRLVDTRPMGSQTMPATVVHDRSPAPKTPPHSDHYSAIAPVRLDRTEKRRLRKDRNRDRRAVHKDSIVDLRPFGVLFLLGPDCELGDDKVLRRSARRGICWLITSATV
jgi:hypothetical protein